MMGTSSWAEYLEPISTEGPAGCDARHEPEHELLRAEIAKLSSLQSEAPDWPQIELVGTKLLADRSKDLLVAVYVACSLAVRQGVAGAAHGASMVAALLARFGGSVFPQRRRARSSALEWYLEWLTVQLGTVRVHSRGHAEDLRVALSSLREAVAELLGPDTPCFVAVMKSCERVELVAAALPAEEIGEPRGLACAEIDGRSQQSSPSKEPAPQAMHPIAPAPRVIAAVPAEPTGAAADDVTQYVLGPPPDALPQLQTYVARAGALLVELARSRFESDRTDPRCYRWLRAGLWLRWEKAPISNRRGRADLDGPASARRAELSKAEKAERWDELLRLSEHLLIRYPLWLDPNRTAALALERLGAGYEGARNHVERESRALLARMPELADLSFSDGTPLGTSETLQWLKPAPATSVPAARETEAPSDLHARLLRSEPDAMVELEKMLRSATGRRSFQLRLALAHALERGGRAPQAARIYLGLERDIDAYHLEGWEPELVLQVLRPLCQILSATECGPHPDATRICARLAQLSPTALL